jgi:3-oxoadipate enol-lactonase
MPTASINGQLIAYDDTGGDGPPIVLAHGFMMDRSMFDPQVCALRHRYRVITWDGRGFGDTTYDGRPFTFWDLAAGCIGLLDHFGMGPGGGRRYVAGWIHQSAGGAHCP